MHLTYCLNIHPGETWREQLSAIRDHALKVRDRVSPGRPFGLGMRLSARSAIELEKPSTLERFREFMARHDLFAFTINGFPYGRFHGARVKERVYQPDWRTVARLHHTNRMARILAALLPEGMTGSISTVPGSFKPCIRTARDVDAMVRRLMECVVFLARLRERTGKEIHLGLEPEPGCFIENTPETVAFFNERLFRDGVTMVRRVMKCGASRAEGIVRRHLGICLDTCHLAIQFEDLAESARAYRREGIRISKVQISAALEVRVTKEGLCALKPFAEGVYLHQVKARCRGGSLLSWNDLPEALAELPLRGEADRARIHFHVPLFFMGNGPLRTTASCLTPTFFRELRRSGVEHAEIETYTFDVLPRKVRPPGVVDCIVREFGWAQEKS